MRSDQAISSAPTNHSLNIRWRQLVPPLAFTIITLIVLLAQSGGIGFWDKHHGWSSSHGLAIMSRSTLENGFVGHARTHISGDGFIGYIYFDRYPVFFSALIGTLINLTDDLPTKVVLARQVMQLIFLATMLFAFLIIRRMLPNPYLALSVVLLAFSSYDLLYYRDMIHFDQPALLGMLILLYAITVYKLDSRSRWLIPTTLVAVGLGRGYASFAILGLWFVVEALGIMVNRQVSVWQRLRAIFGHPATRMLVLGLVWGGLLLGYNLVIEAARREVPLQQTSIVESALRRLPIGEELGRNVRTSGSPIPPWDEFARVTGDRILRWILPGRYPSSDTNIAPTTYPLILFTLALTIIFTFRQPSKRRIPVFLLGFAGIGWIFFMINLTFQHDYTTMYAIGFGLVLYLALLSWLQRYPQVAGGVLLVSLGIFGLSNQQLYAATIETINESNVYTDDYNRVLHAIEGHDRAVYNTFPNFCAILNSKCYVLGFYLGDNYITEDLDAADYVLSSYVYHTSEAFLRADGEDGLLLMSRSLTPDNTVAHLFATAAAEVRHLPEEMEPLFKFGDEFTLHNWSLRDNVTVQPCQRVNLESWWSINEPPPANYSMQIALVDLDGNAISASNTSLTRVPTQVWIPDAYFLDARQVVVPCDAPPGEYPLVLSVYDPDTVLTDGSLPVYFPDGTPSTAYVYLTTLFVEG